MSLTPSLTFEAGRLFKKKNTFTDFTDAAQFLINEKYTSADKFFANGVSAGGMLMGAITNMHPELFKGVIAEVPWQKMNTSAVKHVMKNIRYKTIIVYV